MTDAAEFGERLASIETTLRHMSGTLDGVLAEAKRTNGRITRIETDRAAEAAADGVLAAERMNDKSWRDKYIAPVVTGFVVLAGSLAAGLLGIR